MVIKRLLFLSTLRPSLAAFGNIGGGCGGGGGGWRRKRGGEED